jgi:hypothetical protein
VAIADETRLYTVDAHFEQIAACTALHLYRPGYAGMFSPEE